MGSRIKKGEKGERNKVDFMMKEHGGFHDERNKVDSKMTGTRLVPD